MTINTSLDHILVTYWKGITGIDQDEQRSAITGTLWRKHLGSFILPPSAKKSLYARQNVALSVGIALI